MRRESHIGPRLRELRLERGLSLTAVANATGLSASSLSMTENGKSDITFGRLQQLIRFYGITFTELLPEPAPAEPEVVRAGDRRTMTSPSEGIEVYLLSHAERHALQPMLVTYEPGGVLDDFELTERGEHFWLVLEGELEVTLEGAEPMLLRVGDSVLHETGGRLTIRNRGSVRASFVAVVLEEGATRR